MKISLITAAFLTIMVSAPAKSDTLLLDAIAEEIPNSAEGLLRPKRGMDMSSVKQKFGEPVMEHPWVGDPPISRWDYQGFSVYFENELVLSTVVHR